MAGNGRPVIGPEVKTTLRPETIEALEAEAERQGVKRAELIRSIIEQHLTKTKRSRPS